MVSVEEAMAHARVSEETEATAVSAMIDAAVDHLRSIDVVGLDEVPLAPALHHAILMLVAHFYDCRHAAAEERFHAVPLGVASLVAPYRSMSL